MAIEEIIEDVGLEKFIKTAIKYYEMKIGNVEIDLREKAMQQWMDLKNYKEKVKVYEFMQKQIKKIDQKQLKITHFFKPIQKHIIQEEEDLTNEYYCKTVQKVVDENKNNYRKFYDETYWKCKLENECLTPKQIKTIVNKRWGSMNK